MVNYRRFGIPEEFINIHWDTSFRFLSDEEKLKYGKVYKIADKWFNEIKRGKNSCGLFLTGKNGSGKSVLGSLLIKRFLEDRILAIRLNAVDLQKKFYENWTVPLIALQKMVTFIDEVGKEYYTKGEHAETMFEYILKYRTEWGYPTILASNSGLKQLSERYGETVESLLVGGYVPLNFPEIDLRKRLAKEKMQEILK